MGGVIPKLPTQVLPEGHDGVTDGASIEKHLAHRALTGEVVQIQATTIAFQETVPSVTSDVVYDINNIMISHMSTLGDAKKKEVIGFYKSMPPDHKKIFFKIYEIALALTLQMKPIEKKNEFIKGILLQAADLCAESYKTTESEDVIDGIVGFSETFKSYFETVAKLQMKSHFKGNDLAAMIGRWATKTGRERA